MKKRISEKKVKRKVKEIKSSKKIVEISDKPKGDLEESVESVREFQPNIKIREINSSPVLEKVAEDEGVSWTRTRNASPVRDDDEEVKYKETESDYMGVKPRTNDNRLDVSKLESPMDYESISNEKRSDEMRRLMEQTGERIPGRNERRSWESPEKSMEIEPDDKTKKYVGKGDGY